MKVKRFKNLWAMGLLLFGAILIAFYIAKIFFPQFIIGVAELPSIVKFGNYVDSHKWAYYLYTFVISFLGGYIYCCACCRTYKLSLHQTLVFVSLIIVLMILQVLTPQVYSSFNYVFFVFAPFLMLYIEKKLNKETFISTALCFSIDISAQALSLVIRNIIFMTICINSATMTILLIDTWIWRILLYLFYNYKNNKESE